MSVPVPLAQLAGLAAALSCLVGLLVVWSEKWHAPLSHDHDLDGVQKLHLNAVPRIGGLSVVAGMVLAVAVPRWLNLGWMSEDGVETFLLLLAAGVPAFLSGFIEDVTKKVSARTRLAATLCSAVLASVLAGATVSHLGLWGVDALLSIAPLAVAITGVAVAGGANATNIIDGVNGLSSATVIVMAAALGMLALAVSDVLVAELAALVVGAALGFLLLNYPRGFLFLGDGGAYLLGFLVAEVAVLLLVRHPGIPSWQVLGICAYPVIEVMFSIYRRRVIRGRNVAKPDRLHLHTLLYRRVAPRLLPARYAQRWQRNAVVAALIVPFVALGASASVLLGASVAAAVTLVLLQAALYVAAYRRIVCGRWRPGFLVAETEQKVT